MYYIIPQIKQANSTQYDWGWEGGAPNSPCTASAHFKTKGFLSWGGGVKTLNMFSSPSMSMALGFCPFPTQTAGKLHIEAYSKNYSSTNVLHFTR